MTYISNSSYKPDRKTGTVDLYSFGVLFSTRRNTSANGARASKQFDARAVEILIVVNTRNAADSGAFGTPLSIVSNLLISSSNYVYESLSLSIHSKTCMQPTLKNLPLTCRSNLSAAAPAGVAADAVDAVGVAAAGALLMMILTSICCTFRCFVVVVEVEVDDFFCCS